MPSSDPRFTSQEYAARLAGTRAAMEARGIELLIVSDPSNMAWLTGYDGWSFYVHQAVVVPPAGNPIWYGRGQDAAGAQRTSWLPDADIVGYPDHYVQSTERHPMDYLAAKLAERGLDQLRTGVEMDNYWFSAAAFASLERNLPNARFSDATGLVNWQRAIKSPAEIGYMRQAARIRNVLGHAGILAGPPEPAPTVWLDMPSGDCFSFAQGDGLLEPMVDLGGRVDAGQVVARIHPATRTDVAPVELRARLDGLLVARHFPGLVKAGDCAAVVAVPL